MTDFIVTEGHRFFMISIAAAKRVLADVPMKAGDRLRVLEQLHDAIDLFLTAEMLEMIEPASDAELAMVDAARSLDPKERKPDDPLPPSVEILGRGEVFAEFERINPGIAKAIAYARARDRLSYGGAAPTVDQRSDYFPHTPRAEVPGWVQRLKGN